MKTGISITGSAIAVVAAVALLAGGCTDSGVVATTDSSMRVTANPSTVVIDPNLGEDTGTTQLDAIILDASGFPSSGISLVFRTSAGTLASGGAAIETNENGVASDILTLNIAGPTSVTVDAISGNLEGTATVTVSTVGQNIPPTASFFVSPSPHGWVNEAVTFDGSASNDPDGGITCHQWDIEGAPIIQGEGRPTTATHLYTAAQPNINVVLRVSDDPDVGADCLQGDLPPGSFNGSDTVTQYEIRDRPGSPSCTSWPVAEIVSVNGIIERTLGSGQQSMDVDVDGSRSQTASGAFDTEYTYNCGLGDGPQSGTFFPGNPDLLRWTCNDLGAGQETVVTLYLTSEHLGNPTNYFCSSNVASARIIVNPPIPEP